MSNVVSVIRCFEGFRSKFISFSSPVLRFNICNVRSMIDSSKKAFSHFVSVCCLDLRCQLWLSASESFHLKKEVYFRLYWYLHLHAASEPNELLPCFLLQITADRDLFDGYSMDDNKRKIPSIHISL